MTFGRIQAVKQRTVRILSAADVRRALPMREAIEVMKEAFRRLSQGDAVVPPRICLEVASRRGRALFMPAYLPAEDRMAVKVVTLFDGNAALGLPRIQALVLLLDAGNGSPLAVMDGASLTAIRTGAASGVATELLARSDASVAAVFGAGVQGRTQLEALFCVRPIREVRVVDPDPAAVEAFCREMSGKTGVPVKPASTAAQAVREADVICTATTSRVPVFSDGDLKPGVHINAIGSYQPEVREVPEATVARARIIVDHRQSARAEAGDLLIPLRAGLITEEHLAAELGEVLDGRKRGRTSLDEVTLFKSVGVAVQDLAAAARVFRLAREQGLGSEVAI